jgi:hypothetical protein
MVLYFFKQLTPVLVLSTFCRIFPDLSMPLSVTLVMHRYTFEKDGMPGSRDGDVAVEGNIQS